MIGIITRQDKSPTNKDIYLIYKKVNDVVIDYNDIAIGILPGRLSFVKEVINKCDGIILEGGDYYTDDDLRIIKYIYEQDIPCLGICLGMQSMCDLFAGEIKKLDDLSHYSNEEYVHDVSTKNSFIYGDRVIKVNSRHKYYVKDTSLEVTGSYNNIIEMVEDKSKSFFVGVEWHPEDIYKNNLDANLLFNQFFAIVNKKRLKKQGNMI